MSSAEWAPVYIDRPVEHARDCAHTTTSDACNCYLSWSKDVISATSMFQCATSDGPSDVFGKFDELDQANIRNFVDQKMCQLADQILQRPSSSDLYQPLLQGEIRVLELHPGETGAPLQGNLHIVSIDFTHPYHKIDKTTVNYRRETNHALSLATGRPLWYTALSYVWGVPVFDQTIHFGNNSIAITSSLASALHHLRSNQDSRFFWIDQVCIDQPNTREKEQQIPLMGLIYTHATNTIIWLGDEDGQDPGLAFKVMEHVYGRLQGSDVKITPDDFARLVFPPAEDRSWRAIQQILQRPWLFRLWTIQEAVLSKHLFVQCGRVAVCWDDLAVWCYTLDSCGLLRWLETKDNCGLNTSSHMQPQVSGATIIDSLQVDRLKALTSQEKSYLLQSLVRTRYAQATQAKDKIYGVLGIAESDIVPDYSSTTSARDVYHEACVTQLPQLIYELLSCIDHDTPSSPSWVPDWSIGRVTEALGYSTKAWTLYQAGWKQGPTSTILTGRPDNVTLSADEKQVTLSGILFDKVVALGDVCEEVMLDIDDPQTGNQTWASNIHLIKTANPHQTYPSKNSSVYDAFMHTLLAGRDASTTATPTQDHSDVFSLILDSTTGQMPSLPGQTYTPRRQKGFFTLNSLRTRKPAKTLEDLRTAIRAALTMRRFAITEKGYFALVPRGTREGDEVVVFKKACVPFILRRVNGGDGYTLLGEAYVHGIMKGEVMDMLDLEFEDVVLV